MLEKVSRVFFYFPPSLLGVFLIQTFVSNNPRQECDKEGLKARRLAPMVLQGICPPPCNKCISRLMRMSIAKLQHTRPADMKEIMDKIMG